MDVRSSVVKIVSEYIGCGAKNEREKYLDLLAADVEPAAMKESMATMSSCALTIRGVWRILGCSHEILAKPYKIGRAMSDVVTIARNYDAWHTPGDEYTPGLGDAVIVGKPGNEHVYTICELLGDDTFRTVDGGQGPGGTQIGEVSRRWETRNGVLTDITSTGTVRPIMGYVDVDSIGLTPLACE